MELGGGQRAVLNGSHECTAVLGPSDERCGESVVRTVMSMTGRQRSGRSRTAPLRHQRKACCLPEVRHTVPAHVRQDFGDQAARRLPATRRIPPWSHHARRPRRTSPAYRHRSPDTGRPPANLRPTISRRANRSDPVMQAAKAPTPARPARRSRWLPRRRSHLTSAPARSSARCAERRFPDP